MTQIDLSKPIPFQDCREFHRPDADAVCLAPSPPRPPLKPREPRMTPYDMLCRHAPFTRFEERHYFLKMNYLRFRAESIRTSHQPDAGKICKLLAEADEIRGLIVLANAKLIGFANRFRKPAEDWLSECVLRLFVCADKFNPALGYKFSTFVTFSLRRLRSERRKRCVPTLNASTEDGRELVADIAVDHQCPEPDRRAINRDTELVVSRALRTLPDRWREVMERRFGLNGRDAEIAVAIGDDVGVTRSRIGQIEQRAKRDLRQRLERCMAAEAK